MNRRSTMDQNTTNALSVLSRIGAPVLTVGSLNADLIVATERLPQPGETVTGGDLRILPGGKSANQAAASALLGARTTIIGAVGTDGHGDLLLESLSRKGVRVDRVLRRSTPTGTAIITVDSEAENTIVFSAGANATLCPQDVRANADLFEEAKVLGLCFEVGIDAVYESAKMAREHDVLTVLNVSPMREVPEELLALVDVLIVNEHEMALVSGSPVDASDPDSVKTALASIGVERAVVTLGARGSLIVDAGETCAIPTFPVQPIDTTGAGDSFMGTLMAGLAAGASLCEAASLASAVSAYATIRVGAQSSYANAEEISTYLNGLSLTL